MADGLNVGRYLDEVNAKAKSLQTTINALTKENKELDKALKYDPKNTELLTTKTKNLESAISTATQKLTYLKDKQKEVKKEFEDGIISQSQMNKFNLEIAKATTQVAQLESSLKGTKDIDFTKLASSLKPVSNIAKGILVSLTGIITAYATTGDEISKLMDKFKIGAEEIQQYQLYFDRASGDAGNFKAALLQVNSQLGALEKGSTKAVKAFAMLNLSEADLEGKNAAEALQLIIEKLRLVQDEATRTSIATALLGTSGANVALVAELTTEEIAEMNEELEKTGVITSEQAQQAGELNDRLDDVKFTFLSMASEVGTSFIPVLEQLLELINVFLPTLTSLTNSFDKLSPGMKTALVAALALVAVLPKLITIGSAVAKVIATISAASSILAIKITLIVAAVVALIAGITKLINLMKGTKIKQSSLSLSNILGDTSAISGIDQLTEGTNITNTSIVNNYNYDYSTMTNNISNEVDADEVIEKINVAIKVRR